MLLVQTNFVLGAFVNEHFFFLISTSRNVPTDQIKYIATEKGGKSCTFVPDRIESKTRVCLINLIHWNIKLNILSCFYIS
jgi:hypothetical protein